VTDRRTDGRTELRWLRRAIAVPAVARNKTAELVGLLVAVKRFKKFIKKYFYLQNFITVVKLVQSAVLISLKSGL